MKYDWNDIVRRLNKIVRVNTPVAMKWLKTEEELNAIPPKVKIQTKHFPPCVMVSQSYQFGWTTACKTENYHANYCRGVHGMFDRDDKWFSGEMFNKVWFGNIEASKAHNREIECAAPGYYAILCTPLNSGKIDDPDVIVLYTSSAQAFMLFCGWQYKDYEKLEFTFVGESTCADSWIHTLNTGKPGFAIPSFADRKFGGVGEWEVRVTFTPDGLVRALEGLEAMHKNGLRYPIASYSLTTDMIAGLPETYLKF